MTELIRKQHGMFASVVYDFCLQSYNTTGDFLGVVH